MTKNQFVSNLRKKLETFALVAVLIVKYQHNKIGILGVSSNFRILPEEYRRVFYTGVRLEWKEALLSFDSWKVRGYVLSWLSSQKITFPDLNNIWC